MKKILLIVLLAMFFIGSISTFPFSIIGWIMAGLVYFQTRQLATEKRSSKRPQPILRFGMIMILVLLVTACTPADESVTETTDDVKQYEKSNENTQNDTNEELEKQTEIEESNNEELSRQEVAKQQEQDQVAKNLNLEAVTVARVVDGDTIKLIDGRKLRLIGVNTPESTNRTEQYGKEASNYTTSKLTGKQIWIQKDVSETDRYDRFLRIVWLAVPTNDMDENEIRTKMFNADLVINGYAEPSTYPPDVKYSDYFVKFAREARENNMGLWAYGENGTTKGDLDSTSNATTNTTNHTSDTPTPSTNSSSESFQNCTELRKVYPDGISSDHPAYAPKHDRDKDHWACER